MLGTGKDALFKHVLCIWLKNLMEKKSDGDSGGNEQCEELSS